MTTSYYQKHKEKLRNEALQRYLNIFEEEKEKRLKRLGKDIKILLKKEKRVIRIFLRNKKRN